MRGYPSDFKSDEQSDRILYRLNLNSSSKVPTLLIQSSTCPDWSPLLSKGEYLFSDPLLKQFNFPTFIPGTLYRFRLYGNPTKKSEGKRIGMYKIEDHIKWLFRKGELGGFKLIKADIIRSELVTARANQKSKRITLQAVLFEGILQVEYHSLFLGSLQNGIGSGKAFGFGLLTISKL